MLALKPSASLESADKALLRFRQKMEERHIPINMELVPGDEGEFYIAVDVVEFGLSNTLATRKLKYPRHIPIPNERPFSLLQELHDRQSKLIDTDRSTDDFYEEGMLFFKDPASNRMAEQEIKELAGQQGHVLAVVASDPNPKRRADAIELLNWTPDFRRNCLELIGAIDDADSGVRGAATKYIWARLGILPDDFPFQSLVEALTRQIRRPSHTDRQKAMACMVALARRDPDSIRGIKVFAEDKLKEIEANTVVPGVREMARQLLVACANPPPPKPQPKAPADIGTGF